MLALASRQISSISDIDDKYNDLYARLDNLSVEAEDISESVVDLAEDLSFDEQEAQFIEERLSLIKSLRKKYGADEEEVLAFLSKAKTQYENLQNCAETVEKLKSQIEQLDDKIFNNCVN
jgi:DNA repair protein RecN (Recombination protein N)